MSYQYPTLSPLRLASGAQILRYEDGSWVFCGKSSQNGEMIMSPLTPFEKELIETGLIVGYERGYYAGHADGYDKGYDNGLIESP